MLVTSSLKWSFIEYPLLVSENRWRKRLKKLYNENELKRKYGKLKRQEQRTRESGY